MAGNYRSVFDIIGPVMIGPSSSHTAGAVAIGQEGYKLYGGVPKKATVHYYGSFAQTHRGHGTDYAIAAGILGFAADDLRVPKAPEIAREEGVDLRFVEEEGPSPINHPNTAILDLSGPGKKMQLSGCSIGGGVIEIRQIVIYGITIKPLGTLPIILKIEKDQESESEAELTDFLEKNAPFKRQIIYKSGNSKIYEYDLINYLQDTTIKELKQKFKNIICL
ncbi:serine dehydratase beta chain [Lactobacillus kalixensis]|uniref:L-serine ammonia-lyase n=1 Tax=Lactobacillus kalixensis DSM 16043 TaxID=1423763 RepID=A0A0R1UIX8_9LACO|nr:serine dehydratase beta chain [Lactobacillus kalixensis]KRL91187.1 L-serine dehydratase, beta subunit [Lactobacillus kalixensis DSM 16043]